MKAEFRNRLSAKIDRNDLGALAPLRSPFVLIVDPASHCNLRCPFCPTGHRDLIAKNGRYQGPMSLDLFEKIIRDLNDFPDKLRVLRLYKEGEPLMNRFFPEMVSIARKSGRVEKIDTTTNGVLLTPRNSERIIEAGIDQINISVNGLSTEQFVELVKTKVNFSRYVENIKYLYSIKGGCTIYVKAIQENLSTDDQKRFLEIFGDISDRIFFEHLFPNWPGFDDEIIPKDGNVGLYGGEVREQLVCPYIFYSTTVNSDGTVSLCIQDWARNLIVGDLNFQTLFDVWSGEQITQHRIRHLQSRRKENATCRNCGVMSYSVYDDIDDQALRILARLENGVYS
jgi:radical SAM protein with 4Fe4S-binding SPASM domain